MKNQVKNENNRSINFYFWKMSTKIKTWQPTTIEIISKIIQ